MQAYALGRLVAEGLGVPLQREEHARLRVGVQEHLDHLVGRVEAARELLHEAQRDLGVVRDHLLERRRVDDQARGVLEDEGGRGARLAVEDRHLAEELAAAERRERPVLAADALQRSARAPTG